MSVIKDLDGSEESSDTNIKPEKLENEGEAERFYRRLSILSYFFVLVVLGIPIWWYTTRVYRAALPIEEINDLQLQAPKSSDYGIPLSLEYDILISFVHPEPDKLKIQANPVEIDGYLQGFLTKLSPVADFVVKSQWLLLRELGGAPKKMSDHYALDESQLPHVITPLETKLWSHISPRPSINLVVYFPHCRSPLHIYNSVMEKSATNAFVSPRWGGIYIMNADKDSCETGQFNVDSKIIASTFQQILIQIFKLNNDSDAMIEQFKKGKTQEMIESSKRTLKSLAQLLSEIKSIVISEQVADKIKLALSSIQKSEILFTNGNWQEALSHAKVAFKNSEEAFAHPSLLALLYFPDDQKYAIYIPLFLPVMIPVVMSLTQIRRKKISLEK